MAGLLDELLRKVNTPLPGQINYNDPANFNAPQNTGPMGLLGEAMSENMSQHPVYGGVGDNMGENVTYDNVNSFTGNPNPIDMGSIPPRREMMLQAPPAAQAPEQAPKVDQPKITKDTTLGELQEIEVTAKKRHAEEVHNSLRQEGAAAIQKAGGKEEDLKGWEKFTDDFDLQVVGMALLASNDGSGNIVSNLGQALMLGRQASMERKSSIVQAEKDQRQEKRDERKIAVEEKKAKDADIVARANAGTNAEKNAIQQEGNMLRAKATVLAAQIRASAEAAGMKVAPTNATTTAVAQLAIKQVLGDGDKDTAKQLAQEIGGIIATEQKNAAAAGQSYDPNARAVELSQQLKASGRVQETGMFTSGDWELGKLL